MPIDMATFSTILFLFLFLFTLTTISTMPVPSATTCNATLYPTFCSSILPSQGSRNLFEYAAIAVAKSLSTTFASLDIIYNFFVSDRSLPGAVNDYQYLFHLNADLLSTTNATFSVDDPTDTIHTLLSSVVTDKQTCLDGLYILNDTDIKKELYDSLYNATEMLYSITLSLFVQAKVANGKSHPKPILTPPSPRRLLFHDVEVSGDDLPLTMMRRKNREIFETRSGRRLLQAPDSVVVSQVVVVSQDGTSDFTTITAAVDSAPATQIAVATS